VWENERKGVSATQVGRRKKRERIVVLTSLISKARSKSPASKRKNAGRGQGAQFGHDAFEGIERGGPAQESLGVDVKRGKTALPRQPGPGIWL